MDVAVVVALKDVYVVVYSVLWYRIVLEIPIRVVIYMSQNRTHEVLSKALVLDSVSR